ncbi:hypothetical protein NL676_027384 [Syzygium grande]|nr:hypothetical protein NL676_027384 [Syzygium grande]
MVSGDDEHDGDSGVKPNLLPRRTRLSDVAGERGGFDLNIHHQLTNSGWGRALRLLHVTDNAGARVGGGGGEEPSARVVSSARIGSARATSVVVVVRSCCLGRLGRRAVGPTRMLVPPRENKEGARLMSQGDDGLGAKPKPVDWGGRATAPMGRCEKGRGRGSAACERKSASGIFPSSAVIPFTPWPASR